jgi:hypothetical protein
LPFGSGWEASRAKNSDREKVYGAAFTGQTEGFSKESKVLEWIF